MQGHDAEAVLAEWRAAERTLSNLTPRTPAHAEAEVAVEDAKRASPRNGMEIIS
jgi:hypothetical protein